MTASESSQNENLYVLGHSDAEKVRLTEQDRHINLALGGLLPEQADLSNVHHVLDVACGPGGWALELAEQYPDMQVVGIDIDKGMIEYAGTMARASKLENATFRVMDATRPLDLPDNFFDLVNARFMVGFLPAKQWSDVLQEFLRILHRGGIIRLTESEWGETSSPSYQKSLARTNRAMQLAGLSPSPDGRHIGITPFLRGHLSQAGCVDIQEAAYMIDFSAGTKAHQNIYEDLWIAQKLLQPFQVGMGVATQQEVDDAYEQIPLEMLSEDFYGILSMLTAWGKKP
jgi:ubiquinone/menaquinone biosynthesis C-methylase UbiE